MKHKLTHLRIFIFLSFLMAACHSTPENTHKEKAIPVMAQQVKQNAFPSNLSLSGNVKGQHTVRLGFMVAGKINTITKEEGDKIYKGQLLASLESDRYELGRNMAKAKYEQVKDEYERLSNMYKNGSLPESDFVKISTGLEQAKSQYHLQEKDLQDTRLYAPITGVLLKRGVEPGEIIGQGTPVFAISAIDTIQVHAAVPEDELNNLAKGDIARVTIPALDSTFTGKISLIAPAAEATTRSFNIRIDVANSDLRIKPGMIAEVNISGNSKTNHITIVPPAILKDVDDTHYVYVADAKKQKAYKRKIAIGAVSGNQVAVVSGLNPGEWVITGGQQNLEDGSTITLKK